MNTTVDTPTTGYWLGTGPAEIEHLIAQAETYAPEAEELLARLEPLEGASAIDVGCGALGILPQLRSHVGPCGRVVGLDLEQRLLALAVELAAERGVEIVTVERDAAATGLPTGSFDLVHARTLLINLTNPETILAELVLLARPGGVVALQEPDAEYWVCDPPHPAFERPPGRPASLIQALHDRTAIGVVRSAAWPSLGRVWRPRCHLRQRKRSILSSGCARSV
jgi:ubiquinone/menaquinone biosynthesis C-methylase UbiE